jgi:hypothetical protein
VADETRPDVTAEADVAESDAPETPGAAAPAGGDPDGAAADRDANGRSGVSVPSWLAGALVVVLGLAVGGAGFAIGRATAPDDSGTGPFAPISEQVPGGRELPGLPGFPGGGPGGMNRPDGRGGPPFGGPDHDRGDGGERGGRSGDGNGDQEEGREGTSTDLGV